MRNFVFLLPALVQQITVDPLLQLIFHVGFKYLFYRNGKIDILASILHLDRAEGIIRLPVLRNVDDIAVRIVDNALNVAGIIEDLIIPLLIHFRGAGAHAVFIEFHLGDFSQPLHTAGILKAFAHRRQLLLRIFRRIVVGAAGGGDSRLPAIVLIGLCFTDTSRQRHQQAHSCTHSQNPPSPLFFHHSTS